jgi:DNA-binding NarL/FixJ family response regulator
VLERQPGLRVVGAVGDATAAIREAVQWHPQVVVMDITMPGMNGIDATRVLGDQVPETAVVILSTHASPVTVRRAVEAGARAYVSKDMHTEELVRAVRAAAGGQRYIAEGTLQSLPDGQAKARPLAVAPAPDEEALTTMEQNILTLVAEGRSNAQVAAAIGLTRRTVETYRLRLMRKLQFDNLPSLVKYAIRHGLIPLE